MNPKDRPPSSLSALRPRHPLHGHEARQAARWLLQLADRAPKVKIATYHRRWLQRVCYGVPAKEVLSSERPLAIARHRLQVLERLTKEREAAKRIKDTASRREAVQRIDAHAVSLFPKRKVYPCTHKRFMSILWYVQAGKTKHAQRRQVTLSIRVGGGSLGVSLLRPQ